MTRNKHFIDIPEAMKTERLFLRSYQAGDGPMLYTCGLRNRDHLSEFESGNVLMSLKDGEHAEAVVREWGRAWPRVKVSLSVSLRERPTSGLGRFTWGRLRSDIVLERCVFRREAHLRENKRDTDGNYHGDYLYTISRREDVDC